MRSTSNKIILTNRKTKLKQYLQTLISYINSKANHALHTISAKKQAQSPAV